MPPTPPIRALRFPLAVDAALGRVREEHDLDEYVRQLIRQVLLTNPGERINRPDFGAGVRRLLFAPNNPGSAAVARAMIQQALDDWLSTLISVEEVKTAAQNEKLLVDVVYVVRGRGTRRFLNLEVTL